jgi:xanthine dehydrogenase accessory factor
MRDIVEQGTRWLQEGVGFGRATAVRVVRPSPFRVGRTLLVADDGRLAGAVSAGCVEGAAAEAVLAARRGQYREVVRYGVSDARAADVGLVCGGNLDVLVEPDVPAEVLAVAAGEGDVAVATPLPAGREAPDVERVLLDATGIRSGSLGDPEADATLAELARAAIREGTCTTVQVGTRDVYVEVFAAPTRLVVVGAGEIAVHLVRLAHAFGLRTVVVDGRAAFATPERFPDADEILVGWLDEVADRAGIDEPASVIALTHDAKFDDPAIVVALRRGARYVGALGSRRTHAARMVRLRESGIGEADLARIHGPIGLDLGGDTPVEIALAILAEIVAERHRPGSDDAGADGQRARPDRALTAVGLAGEPGAPVR